jgi:hypothetical protein
MSGAEFEYRAKISCNFSVLPYKHWDDTKTEVISTLHDLPNTVFINHPTVHATHLNETDVVVEIDVGVENCAQTKNIRHSASISSICATISFPSILPKSVEHVNNTSMNLSTTVIH